MEDHNDIEKQIELKKLEIEKLKLEKELALTNTPDVRDGNGNQNDGGKYRDLIGLNIFFLLAVAVSFYVLPWGRFGANIDTAYGSQSFITDKFTGFNLELFICSYPLTILNIVLLVFIIRNSLKAVGIISIIGLIVALIAVFNVNQVGDMHTNFSNSFSSVSSGFKPTAYCYILPVSYFLLFVSNIGQKKVASVKQSNIKKDREDLEGIQRDEEIYQAKLAEQELLLAEKKLKEQSDNNKHSRDDIKYLLSTKIELGCLISLLAISYFMIKLNDGGNPVLIPVFLVCILISAALLVENIFVLFILAKTLIKTSFKAIVFKLCFYSAFLISILTYLFNQVFLNYDVVAPVESYLIIGYLSLLTILLITVINEKKAIQLNANPNSEKHEN